MIREDSSLGKGCELTGENWVLACQSVRATSLPSKSPVDLVGCLDCDYRVSYQMAFVPPGQLLGALYSGVAIAGVFDFPTKPRVAPRGFIQ